MFFSFTHCENKEDILRVLRIILVILPEHPSDTYVFTMKMEILLEPTSNKLLVGALLSDTIKNPKLSTYPVFSNRSFPTEDPQCSTHIHGLINAVTIHPKQQSDSYDDKIRENEEEEKDSPENIDVNPFTPPEPSVSFITRKVLKLNSFFKLLGLVPQSSDA
ncbi:hypothetical protein Tco_1114875 [Tanacetum coccineum]